MKRLHEPILDYSAWWWTSDTFASTFADHSPVGHLYRFFRNRRLCPYCRTETIMVFGASLPGREFDPFEDRSVELWACLNCGWWYDEFAVVDPTFIGWERVKRRVRYLREFRVGSKQLPIRALALELRRHPRVLHAVDPTRLEVFVAAVLAEFFDVEVSVLGRSGDGGIDLVYVDADRPFAVQVKRRESPCHREGVALVREFLGACLLRGYKDATIVTTAERFTVGAVAAAREATRRRFVSSFELIARDRLIELCGYTSLAHRYPWTATAEGWIRDWRDKGEYAGAFEYLE